MCLHFRFAGLPDSADTGAPDDERARFREEAEIVRDTEPAPSSDSEHPEEVLSHG